MNDEWKLTQYRPKDSDAAWFFRKNMTPRISPGDASCQYVGYLTFHFEPRDATGLPKKQDNDILYRIEEHEMGFLEEANLSVHIASVVKEGVKDHIFQISDPDKFLEEAVSLRNKYPEYYVECEIMHDPNWSHYDDFP